MSRNFKTDKGYKVVCDYMDWYYTRMDLREYFALDELGEYIVFDWAQCDLKDIRDLPIDNEWLDYLLYRRVGNDEYKQKILRERRWFDYEERDLKYLDSRRWRYEKDYEIRPFYISYYGSGNYRLQFCEAHEAQGIILIDKLSPEKKRNDYTILKIFEHYIEDGFLYVQIYSPHSAYFEEWELRSQNWITFREYEDGWIYYIDEDEAFSTIPDYAWKILRETESQSLEVFELIPKKKRDN